MTDAIAHQMQFFVYAHLPEHLQGASKPFADLAADVCEQSNNPETAEALRFLKMAKDAAVRAVLVEGRKADG